MDERDPQRRHGAPGPEREGIEAPPPGWQLWVSFIGAPTLWLLHFLLFYLAVERFCAVGGDETFGRWALIAGTALTAVAAAGLGVVALRVGRRARLSPPVYDDFLPRVGVVSALAAAFVLVLEGLPLFFVSVCR